MLGRIPLLARSHGKSGRVTGGGGGEQRAPLFFADWATQSGNSTTAFSDGGKFDLLTDTGGIASCEVITPTGLGFPTNMAKVVRIGPLPSEVDSGPIGRKTSGIAIPAVGESLYYRWYYRHMQPEVLYGDFQTHPFQDGNAQGDTNWMWLVYHYGMSEPSYPFTPASNQWCIGPQFNATAFPNLRTFAPPLQRALTYRVEQRIHRIGATTFNYYLRVYDEATSMDVPVVSEVDLVKENGAAWDNPTLTFHNVNNLAGINFGNNGIGSNAPVPPWPILHSYQGGLAVTSDDYCGRYGTMTGEAAI